MKLLKKTLKAIGVVASIAGVTPEAKMVIAGAKVLTTLSKDKTETVKIAEKADTETLLDWLEAGATVLAKRTDNIVDDGLIDVAKAIRKEYKRNNKD